MSKLPTIIQDLKYREDVFEPTEEFPSGYVVWAIGRHNFPYDCCVPLCVVDADKCVIVTKNRPLRYIKVATEELALRILNEAVTCGCDEKKFNKIINEFKLNSNDNN